MNAPADSKDSMDSKDSKDSKDPIVSIDSKDSKDSIDSKDSPTFTEGEIKDVVVYDLKKYFDDRGWLAELFRQSMSSVTATAAQR